MHVLTNEMLKLEKVYQVTYRPISRKIKFRSERMHTYFQIYSSILFKLINYENITHISKSCTLKRDTFVTAFSIPVLVNFPLCFHVCTRPDSASNYETLDSPPTNFLYFLESCSSSSGIASCTILLADACTTQKFNGWCLMYARMCGRILNIVYESSIFVVCIA